MPKTPEEQRIADVMAALNDALMSLTARDIGNASMFIKQAQRYLAQPAPPASGEKKESGLSVVSIAQCEREGVNASLRCASAPAPSPTCPHGYGPDVSCIECEPTYPSKNGAAPSPDSRPECGKDFETLCNKPRGHKGLCGFEAPSQPDAVAWKPCGQGDHIPGPLCADCRDAAQPDAGTQDLTEQFWPIGIEKLQREKHWSTDQIIDMFGPIVCEFAQAYYEWRAATSTNREGQG